jgi:membrane complex biogenesis BtpA family protein
MSSTDFDLTGVLHLLPLPAAPLSSPGLSAVLERALHDAETLLEGGISSCIIENLGDAPFVSGMVQPHVPAMLAVIGSAIRARFGSDLALGINILRNDVMSALGAAAACGAGLVRVNVHVGAAWTDQGLIEGRAHETLRYRRELGAQDIRIAADVLVKHATPAGQSDIQEVARETAWRGGADVLIVTGSRTGGVTDLRQVELTRTAVPDRPIWVGSGVTPGNLPSTRKVADGAIVGTWLHRDGELTAPLDVERVRRLVER